MTSFFYVNEGKMIKNKIILFFWFILALFSLVSCSPTYEEPTESPIQETKSAAEPYSLDFVQINNNIIDTYSAEDHLEIYPFISDLEIDGDNDTKTITLNLSVSENTTDEAILALLSDMTIQISDEAHMQDFRFTNPSSTDFGSFYTVYNYHYVIKRGEDIFLDETINAGDSVPFDPSLDIDSLREKLDETTSN